ncbi:hypothetical protein ACC675_37010, partial [Rhizobium ruizarguesonis]
GLLSDRIADKWPLLAGMALMGFIGSMMLPLLLNNWLLMAGLLLFWGGCVSGLYTFGLSHLGSLLTGSDLACCSLGHGRPAFKKMKAVEAGWAP